MYKDIIHFLDSKRLNEALTQLSAYMEGIDNWSLRSKWETLSSTYGFMKQYAAQGMNDPQRNVMFDDLIAKTYGLADETHLITEAKNHNSEFSKAICGNGNVTKSFKELAEIIELNDLENQTKDFHENKISQQEFENIRKKNEDTTDDIFLKAWTGLIWNDSEYADAESIANSDVLPVNILSVFVSGITLSLLKLFDEKKFILLVKIYQTNDKLSVSQRALTGILLTVYFQEERFRQHPNAIAALNSLKDLSKTVGQIHNIQTLLLLSRETEKIDKKMREEIIPQMMKNSKLMDPNFKIENLEDLEDFNPEWEKGKENFTNKIKEITDLQMEGADTYMSTFAQLKHYPFFKIAAHWFYPFDKNNSYVANTFSNESENPHSLFSMLQDTCMFCNSDKFSFYMTLESLHKTGMDMLNARMFDQDEARIEGNRFARLIKEEETALNVCRQYIQDLYRFFKVWMFRSEINDIFKDQLTLWKNEFLHDLILQNDSHQEIANYLFTKEYMSEAAQLYEELGEKEALDAETLQKLGFCYQKMKDYPKAIAAYKQADIIKSDNIWTMKHLAVCYKRMDKYQEALTYFNKLIELQPENLNLLLQTGQCLAILERYDEALNHFYKVEYLGESTESAQRAIGWCYFMSGKYEKAILTYKKIIESNTPEINDWLNSGHAYLANGETTEAIRCYKNAETLCKTHDEFMEVYLADKDALLKQGIEENSIYIVADIL